MTSMALLLVNACIKPILTYILASLAVWFICKVYVYN